MFSLLNRWTIPSNMPKKMGVNSTAEEARARKSATETERKRREKEEQSWCEAEGSKLRSTKKCEEEAEKRAEALAHKAKAQRLAEQEEKELEKSMRKPDKKATHVLVPVPKVTEAKLRRRSRREDEQAEMARKAEEGKRR